MSSPAGTLPTVNVVFVEPSFPANQRKFVAGLAQVGATVIGIGETPEDQLDGELRSQLAGYYRVGNITDEGQLNDAVLWAQSTWWVDRLEATINPISCRRLMCVRRGASPAPRCAPPGCAATNPR